MGKNKRKQLEAYDCIHNIKLMVDSQEEVDFLNWLCEAKQLGIIVDFEYQPEPIKLFDSVDFINSQKKKRNLFREHVYTPDFAIIFKPGVFEILDIQFKVPYDKIIQDSFKAYIDVKGTFMSNGSGRSFSINQKWVYQTTGIYVQKVIPKEFFQKMGCPKLSFMTRKTNKARKMFSGCKSINQIFNINI